MIKLTKHLIFLLWVLVLSGKITAQLSGIYTIPVNYPSIAAAISALNTQGVSGPVIFNITSGYTETAPLGGYALTATGTALNTITFRKMGAGVNPLITAYTGGTNTPASATQDGVWRLIGCDYITINGIDIIDPNTTNPSTMEYGYGLFKASASDGCQYNTIQNCSINLKTINNATGSGPAVDGSRGINVVSSLPASQTTVLTPTASSGTNSGNKFYSNIIQNCNIGIALIGYAALSPFTLADTGNDIGGATLPTGNNIINFGGAAGATNPAAGIRTLAQYNLNVSNNLINNNTGSGANHITTLRGAYLNTATSANVTISNNTLTINSAGTGAQVSVIENVSGATAANNTVSITNNLITNCTFTPNTTGSFFGIYNNGASASYLNIDNNVFEGVITNATTGSNYLIYNTGAVTNAISMTNNLMDNCANSASSSGSYYYIFNNVVSTAALNISNNVFSNSSSLASTGAIQMIYNSSATSSSITLSNNTVSNCTGSVNSTGAFYGIYNNGSSSANLDISGNSFLSHTVTSFSGPSYLIYNSAAITNSISLNGNVISNCSNTITSTGSYYAIYNNAAPCINLDMSSNIFSGNSSAATTGSIQLIFNRGAATNTFNTVSSRNNLVTNCTYSANSTAPFLGIYNSGVSVNNLNITSNTLTANTWLTASSARYLIYNTGNVSNTLNLTNNIIAACVSTINTTGTFNGIYNTGSVTVAVNICDNTFSNNINTATTGGTYLLSNSGAVAGGAVTMTNNLVAGCTNSATGLGDFYGVSNSGTTFSTLNASSNTYTNNSFFSSTGVVSLIYNTGAVSTTITSINLSNNQVANCTSSVNSSGAFYGIYNNAASCGSLNMSNNTFTNVVSYATGGSDYLIYNRGAITNTFASVNLSSNLVSNCTNSASSNASFYGIWNNGVTSTLTSISNNTITNTSWATTTALRYLISNWGVGVNNTSISNNVISNCTSTNNTTGFFYGIYNNNNTAVSSGALSIGNNIFRNNSTAASAGETHFINTSGVISNTYTSIDITNNLFSNCSATITAAGPFYGMYNNTTSANSINLSANTFSNNFLVSAT
jgi:hypothetical protein